MPTQTMFVLTPLTCKNPETAPHPVWIQAGLHAVNIAEDTRIPYEKLEIGSSTEYGRIRGHVGYYNYRERKLHVMEPSNNPSESALQVLRDNANRADGLANLGFWNPNKVGKHVPERLIYPDLFADFEGLKLPATAAPDHDIYGRHLSDGPEGRPGDRYLRTLAAEPLAKLHQAQFEVDYLLALLARPDHIVVALQLSR